MRALSVALGFLAFVMAASLSRADTLVPADVVPMHINELPFYGGVPKTREMLEADAKLKVDAIAVAGSARAASDLGVDIAWRSFQNGKLNDAMERANQAWLLDNENYRVYWTMALIQRFRVGYSDEVKNLFIKAIEEVGNGPQKAEIERDYHTFLSKNDGNRFDNLAQVHAQYKAARQKLVSKAN